MNAKGDKEERQNPEHIATITLLMRRQRLLCPPSHFESLVFTVKCERLSAAPSFPANKQNVSDYFIPVERIKTKKHRQAASFPASVYFWNKKYTPPLAVSGSIHRSFWATVLGNFLTEFKAERSPRLLLREWLTAVTHQASEIKRWSRATYTWPS